jgi:hypothetical protein
LVFSPRSTYIEWSRQQTNGLEDPQALLRAGGRATRDFARSYPNRYRVMTQFQLNLQDPETSPLIQEVFRFLKLVLQSYNLSETKLIDAMRMVNAAITGFIAIEQAGLMTLERSTDASYEMMIDALVVAIQHIQKVDSWSMCKPVFGSIIKKSAVNGSRCPGGNIGETHLIS